MPSVKFVRKKRIYLKRGPQIYPFIWIEFLDDASFSLGFMSKQVKMTGYGSAIQRGLRFQEHTEVMRRGRVQIGNAEAPHYTFHPPALSQRSGIVHVVDQSGKIDEWEFDWFPVAAVDHIVTVHSGRLELLGTVAGPRKNHSIVAASSASQGMRMDMFICPVGARVELDPLATDNIIGWCKHYELVCSFYPDDTAPFSIYVANEMKARKTN